MWSVGCIFAELLGLQVGSTENFLDRCALFEGKSSLLSNGSLCDLGTRPGFERDDQLCKILQVIGTPGEEEISRVTNSEAKAYLQGLQKKSAQVFLSQLISSFIYFFENNFFIIEET